MLMKSLLAAGALILSGSAVLAQDYDDSYGPGPDESIVVIAPRIRPDDSSLAPTSATKLSMQVRYDDLDLTTRDGARELRSRVRDAAQNVCETLADRFPHPAVPQEPCYKSAVASGLARADNAISDARHEANYEY
jgi:UrcA family protein